MKELRESVYSLKAIKKAELLPLKRLEDIPKEASELSNIIAKSIFTARKNKKGK